MYHRTRNFILVIGGIVIFFAADVALAVMLAMRDARTAVDFVFKVFGASMAFLFAAIGPLGLIGLALMSGNMRGVKLVAGLACAALASILLLVYVMNEFDVFSLFAH
ncbi:MAG TPA: hypothetical protein PKJ16_09915 [Spirochaetota bacterium]|nr:hypothetical protein [Spirochaetota bacterium]HPU86992.1 hypothetical protein [Spirochaetota bacterium]